MSAREVGFTIPGPPAGKPRHRTARLPGGGPHTRAECKGRQQAATEAEAAEGLKERVGLALQEWGARR